MNLFRKSVTGNMQQIKISTLISLSLKLLLHISCELNSMKPQPKKPDVNQNTVREGGEDNQKIYDCFFKGDQLKS